jgi:hypothetical protein
MLKLISFRADGSRVQVANEEPAFYGLAIQGKVIDYFGTLEAVAIAAAKIVREFENDDKTQITE